MESHLNLHYLFTVIKHAVKNMCIQYTEAHEGIVVVHYNIHNNVDC